jgi:hypothetical protein
VNAALRQVNAFRDRVHDAGLELVEVREELSLDWQPGGH